MPASKWKNPFKDGTREEVIATFRENLLGNAQLMADLHELRGRDLACWRAPLPCHGDVLAELANRRDEGLSAWRGCAANETTPAPSRMRLHLNDGRCS